MRVIWLWVKLEIYRTTGHCDFIYVPISAADDLAGAPPENERDHLINTI